MAPRTTVTARPTSGATRRFDMYDCDTNLSRVEAVRRARRAVTVPDTTAGLTIVVLNLDRWDLMGPLSEQLDEAAACFEAEGLGCQIIIGDTGSTDSRTLRGYEGLSDRFEVIRLGEYQFSRSNNDCVAGRARHDVLLFLNNDVSFEAPDQVLMLHRLASTECGVLGVRLDYPNGKLQHAGMEVLRDGPLMGFPYHRGTGEHWPRSRGSVWNAVAVTGAVLLVHTEDWVTAGGFDEAYEREAQDIDLCLRIHRLGGTIRVADVGPVTHLENATRQTAEEDASDRRLLMRRWRTYLEQAVR